MMVSISWRQTNGLWTGEVVQFCIPEDQTGLGRCEFDMKLFQFGGEYGQICVGLARNFCSLLFGQMGLESKSAINISFVDCRTQMGGESREFVV